MNYQRQLMDTLDQCQQVSVKIQSTDDITLKKDIRDSIKSLVKLQDEYDDAFNKEEVDIWEQQVQQVINQVQKKIQPFSNGTTIETPFVKALQNKKMETSTTVLKDNFNNEKVIPRPTTTITPTTKKVTTESNTFNSPFNQSRFSSRPSPSLSTPWTSTTSQEDKLVYQINSISIDDSEPITPTQSSTIHDENNNMKKNNIDPLPKSNSTLSMFSLPANVIDAPSPKQLDHSSFIQPHGRQSLSFDEFPEIQNETERRSRLTIPLFKNLGISQSSPVPGAPVQINFYNDSDATENKLFATDAIVSHPLRIGVGYGSYICYSCTVFSNKGTPITVRKRYSDFVEIRQRLVKQYPHLKSSIPKLPPKKVVGKFTPTFVEQRRRDLEYFFKYIFLHPTLGSSTIVKQWITPVSV